MKKKRVRNAFRIVFRKPIAPTIKEQKLLDRIPDKPFNPERIIDDEVKKIMHLGC